MRSMCLQLSTVECLLFCQRNGGYRFLQSVVQNTLLQYIPCCLSHFGGISDPQPISPLPSLPPEDGHNTPDTPTLYTTTGDRPRGSGYDTPHGTVLGNTDPNKTYRSAMGVASSWNNLSKILYSILYSTLFRKNS